jgi:hypothetical protein
MNTKQLSSKLLPLLESSEGTAEFLEGVKRALETLYLDASETDASTAFGALDQAIEAFRVCDDATR